MQTLEWPVSGLQIPNNLPGHGLPLPRAVLRRRSPEALQTLVSETLTRLAHARLDEMDAEIQSALQRILSFFDLERCILFRRLEANGAIEVCFQAQGNGLMPLAAATHIEDDVLWALEQAARVRSPAAINAPGKNGGPATFSQGGFKRWSAGAMLLLPSGIEGEFDYYVTLASRRRGRILSMPQTRWVHLLCEAIVSTLRRRDLERVLTDSERFAQLVANLTAGFAGAQNDEIDRQIMGALQQLLTFTDADHCGVYTIQAHQGSSCLTHLASSRVKLPVGSGSVTEHSKLTPWAWTQLMHQKVVVFSNPLELPPEAATDQTYFIDVVHAQSALFIPYPVDGATMYFLAVVFSRGRQYSWSEPFIERLKSLGWAFVGALNRANAAAAYARAQQQLMSSRRLAVASLKALHESLCLVDAEGTIVELSDSWRDLGVVAGIAPHGASVGTPLMRAYEATQAQDITARQMAAGLGNVLNGRTATFEMESSHATATGLQWLKTSVWRFAVDDQLYAAIGLKDVTKRRRGDEELAELRAQHWHAERVTRTGVLVASLAHEISQPLAAILSNAQAGLRFLRDETAPDRQEFIELLSDIVADNKRAAKVIESLRLMLRRQKAERVPVDMADIVQNVVSMLHVELMRQQVTLEQDCAHGCIAVVDQAQIQQVLLNLMTNGMESMQAVTDSPRKLRVAVSPAPPGHVRIEVSDSGAGFTQAHLDKAFEAFWTTKPRGTGLGLAICHSIVLAHDGRIWVEPKEQAGATLVVTLPAAVPSPLATPPDSRQPG